MPVAHSTQTAKMGDEVLVSWIQRNDFEALRRYLLANAYDRETIGRYAIQEGNLAVLQWAYCPDDAFGNRSICPEAAAYGQRHILEWAMHEGLLNAETWHRAAAEGRVDSLQWLYDQRYPWGTYTCACAAENGRLDVLQWLHEHGCPWGTETCASAAKYGDLYILRWLRDRNCPWDALTCRAAAYAGHLEVLQWARAQGCPCDISHCAYYAIGKADYPMLNWLFAQASQAEQQSILKEATFHFANPEFYNPYPRGPGLLLWAVRHGYAVPPKSRPVILDRRTPWHVASELLRRLPGHVRLTPEFQAWRARLSTTLDEHVLPELTALVVEFL